MHYGFDKDIVLNLLSPVIKLITNDQNGRYVWWGGDSI